MDRAALKRQLRDDEKRIAYGIDAAGMDGDGIVSLMRVLRDKLRVCIQRKSSSVLMHFLYANMAQGGKLISDVPIACGRGCSHCCNIWVDAMAPEIFYTIGSMNGQQRRNAGGSVARAIEITDGKSFDERGDMVTPCPLLAGDDCSVYSARPVVCRTAVSADADICRRSYREVSGEDIPTPLVWNMLRQGYGIALEGALLHAGLPHHSVEWNSALQRVLASPDIEARWFGGEDVFAGLPRASNEEPFEIPIWRAMYIEAFGEAPPVGMGPLAVP